MGVRNHIKQWVTTRSGFDGLFDEEEIVPNNKPHVTIMGAKYLIGVLKFGSQTGAIKSQFVIAPPVMAAKDRMITLKH